MNAQTLTQYAFKYCTKFLLQQLKAKDTNDAIYYAYLMQYLSYRNIMRLGSLYTQDGKGRMLK